PRALIASFYFYQACRIGDAGACERYYGLREPSAATCEQDPFACGWRVLYGNEPARADEACSLGVADACAFAGLHAADPAASRAYVETACQLGSPNACGGLGLALSDDCEPDDYTVCYEPDDAAGRPRFGV